MKRLKNFINGEFVDSASAEELEVVYPVAGETVALSPVSTEDEVDAAMRAAQ